MSIIIGCFLSQLTASLLIGRTRTLLEVVASEELRKRHSEVAECLRSYGIVKVSQYRTCEALTASIPAMKPISWTSVSMVNFIDTTMNAERATSVTTVGNIGLN